MSSYDGHNDPASSFSGLVRLFPLPGTVVFPHALIPLHIFEPRYRAMMEETIAGDRLIAMAVLAPGWEAAYEGRPPVYPVACLGRVVTHQRLDDGRFTLLLAGVQRVRLIDELPPDKPFREARGELIADEYPSSGAVGRAGLQRQLLDSVGRSLTSAPELRDQLEQLLSREITLGTLTDLLGYALDVGLELKTQLLAEADVDRRAALLIERLQHVAVGGSFRTDGETRTFPPDVSLN